MYLGGASYFATCINDASRKVEAYALKTKDQVLEIFKQFHVQVERETWKLLKHICIDNGSKYRGPFEEYYRKYDILHEKTISKTLQHTGVAERINCTIIENFRCTFSHVRLPKSFWGEEMNIAVYLINFSTLALLNGDVTKRVWTKKNVFVHTWRCSVVECLWIYLKMSGPNLMTNQSNASS